MQKNRKILLVLDWSNLMFRSLFMNGLYGNVSGYNRIEDIRSFMYKFTTDICSVINIFKPSNIIIATDAQHAWRKYILPGDNIDDGYKSNRKKSDNINWDNIYGCSDNLQNILEQYKMHIGKTQHIEADDIAAMCKELVFEKYNDYNIIIVSADADIRQLIDFNPVTQQYCIVYNTTGKGKNSKRKLYGTEEFYNWINTDDNNFDIFFENEDLSKQYIKDLLRNNTVMELTVENPNDVVINKILCGDDGDCVPAFYNWYSNGKKMRITPGKCKKIRELLGINKVNDIVVCQDQLKPVFEKVCKLSIDDIDFKDRLTRQRILVELNSTLFPGDISNYKDTLDYMIQDTPDILYNGLKAQNILSGTEYDGYDKKKVLEAEVFKDMNKYLNSDGTVNTQQLF